MYVHVCVYLLLVRVVYILDSSIIIIDNIMHVCIVCIIYYEYNVYTYIKLTCKYPSTTCSTMHSLESPHDQPYHYLSYVTFSGF